ncbi:hypothetical protein D3C86_1218500 [compost metagenome]
MSSKIQSAAAIEPDVAAHGRELDASRIGIRGHVEELFGKAADIDLRAIAQGQVAGSCRHVDAAAKRNSAAAEHNAGAGQAQA